MVPFDSSLVFICCFPTCSRIPHTQGLTERAFWGSCGMHEDENIEWVCDDFLDFEKNTTLYPSTLNTGIGAFSLG